MAQKRKSTTLVKTEFIIFAVLLTILLVWASNKCTRTQEAYETEFQNEQLASAISDSLAVMRANQARANQATQAAANSNNDTIRGSGVQIIKEKILPLYVTIDGLNMRTGPGLNYGIVDRLPLYAEVNFMNEVTDSLYEIKLGNITPKKPWVKVKNKKGKTGWVYGAGVDYYKYKLEGVEE